MTIRRLPADPYYVRPYTSGPFAFVVARELERAEKEAGAS